MSDYKERRGRLQGDREATFRKLGRLSDNVLSRPVAIQLAPSGPELSLWPGGSGVLRIIHAAESFVVVTDGISDPWDPELYPAVPAWTFDFEIAIQVPKGLLRDGSEEAVASSWIPALLWSLTDWVVSQKQDIKRRVERFDCITLSASPVRGLEAFIGSNGHIGTLVGIPFVGDHLGAQAVAARLPDGEGVFLLTAKLLWPEEYDWALGVADSSRTVAMAEAFMKRGDSYVSAVSSTARPSILPALGVTAVPGEMQG